MGGEMTDRVKELRRLLEAARTNPSASRELTVATRDALPALLDVAEAAAASHTLTQAYLAKTGERGSTPVWHRIKQIDQHLSPALAKLEAGDE